MRSPRIPEIVDVDVPGAGLVASRHTADVGGTPKARADRTEALSSKRGPGGDDCKAEAGSGCGALGPHLIRTQPLSCPGGPPGPRTGASPSPRNQF